MENIGTTSIPTKTMLPFTQTWESSLPSAANLIKQIEMEASADGDAFYFKGYTLWREHELGGWSLTNAYGIDDCAFLSTERQFQWLLDTIQKGEEVGPVP